MENTTPYYSQQVWLLPTLISPEAALLTQPHLLDLLESEHTSTQQPLPWLLLLPGAVHALPCPVRDLLVSSLPEGSFMATFSEAPFPSLLPL